ncbi:MAG: hypothetical protein KDA44_04235 [Planctomycetales bacterium]|nr:hypothetical protein [Planctomycetales bacterium]
MTPRTALFAATALVVLLPTGAAEARLFVQTYGATVPAGDGCVWSVNQDYFVPRYCDSCRYGLFSECKDSRTISAACRNCHAIYPGYCSPYGACRYRWRDHVYKTHCGCTPLRTYHGPWREETCRKGCGCLASTGCGRGGSRCVSAATCQLECVCDQCLGGPTCTSCEFGVLPHVEPAGGTLLGMLPAPFPGAGGMPLGAGGNVPAAGVNLPTLPPTQGRPLPTNLPGFGF